MERRRVGRGGPEVFPLGIGAMSFASVYGEVTEEQCHAILDTALETGIDHIDTANVYGMGLSEEVIGRFLRRYRGKGGQPFHIATKAGICSDANAGERWFDNSLEHMEAQLDQSLIRLGLEQVDLFYVHRRDMRFEIEEVTESLASLVRKGKIAGFGFSEIAPSSLRRAAAVHHVAAVQSEYSLQTRLPELGMVQACEQLGTLFVAFSPVGRGLLTDDPPTPDRVSRSSFFKMNPRFAGENLSRNLVASQPLRDIGRKIGQPAAAVAIAWLLSRGPAVLPIPGTRSTSHLRELLAGCELVLSDELLEEIETRLPPGWTHGARYSSAQSIGPEQYC